MLYQANCLPQAYLRDGVKALVEKGLTIRRAQEDILMAMEKNLAIHHRRHKEFPNLIQLKYDQIDADFTNELVRQCRGIILDEMCNYNIVARPFDKFANYGESYAAEIDWRTATVQEKLDGSLCIMYHYNGRWHVATSGTPDASGDVNGSAVTFADLFWDTYQAKHYKLPTYHQRQFTFMFELTSPFNKIVVHHKEPDLRLLAVRNVYTGYEIKVTSFVGWNIVPHFGSSSNLDTLLASFKEIDPTKQEGYVVVDEQCNRIKVKHPGYVALHHMRDKLTPRGLTEVIRSGESSEVASSFPEWAEMLNAIKARYDGLAMELEQEWNEMYSLVGGPRKLFAEAANKTRVPTVLYLMLDGKIESPREHLSKMNIEHLMEILQVREIIDQVMVGA